MKKQLLALLIAGISAGTSYAQTAIPKPIDPSEFDSTTTPGDDFFQYVNGPWVKKTVIPPSQIYWGSFTMLDENNTKLLRQLLENASKDTGKVAQMIGDFYVSGMDSIGLNKQGYAPIKPELDKIAHLNDLSEVLNQVFDMQLFVSQSTGLNDPLFDISVETDIKKTTQSVLTIGEGGTFLPDRDYYLNNDSATLAIRNEYRSYIIDLFKLTGVDPETAANNAAAIIDLETKLAKVQLTKVEERNIPRLYNKFLLNDLNKKTPHIDWKTSLVKIHITGQDSAIVDNPAFFSYMDSLLPTVSMTTWKAYLQWNVISNAANYLSDDFVNRRFHFYKVLYGQKQIRPRWQRVQRIISNSVSDLLGQLYVDAYFKPEAKERMIKLVNNLIETFGERIQRLDWMSAATKAKALLKLEAMKKKIAYPDKWKSYDNLVITKDSYYNNVMNAAKWAQNFSIAKLGKPTDKTEWGMSPQTVNAQYHPPDNDITFPAAILQPPFFYADADDAVNYGAIGSIIGHEITHGFDDQGRLFDKDGNLNDWWTTDDAKGFKIKADSVVAEYNAFTVLDSIHVNGSLTLGENLADLGGLNIAYEAFKKTPEGRSDTLIDGLTPDQRFFICYALTRRSIMAPAFEEYLIINDPHSPDYWRADGVVYNVDAFYKAFNITGGKMYKPEDKRIKIW
jgi:putative endopeptidase